MDLLLAMGMSKTELWTGKMVAAGLISLVASVFAVVSTLAMSSVMFHLLPSMTVQSLVMCCVTAPAFGFGVLSIISTGYWYFHNVAIFSFIFPLVAFIGVWSLSMQFAARFPGFWLVPTSLATGIALWVIGRSLVGWMPKERIAGGMV